MPLQRADSSPKCIKAMVDVDSQVPADTIAAIAAIDGVLAVRYLALEA